MKCTISSIRLGIFIWSMLLSWWSVHAIDEGPVDPTRSSTSAPAAATEAIIPADGTASETVEPLHAVFFPSFTLTVGVVVFWMLTRYSFAKALPYTAVMFMIGCLMGIGAQLMNTAQNHIDLSLRIWIPIDSEVLLLVFLPGLIFKDSMGLNVNLFRIGFGQIFMFAFPMVLAGAILTALIAYYIFPYG